MYQKSSGSSRFTWMLTGMAIGALSMFIMDPAQGNSRRTIAKDRMNSARTKVSNATAKVRSSIGSLSNKQQRAASQGNSSYNTQGSSMRGNNTFTNSDSLHAAPGVGAASVVGAHGGTDAAAGAQLSGSKQGGPGGASLRETVDATGAPGTPGGMVQGNNISPGAGATAAGGTGLGSSATADDTRTGTGTESGSGTALVGGGMSGARDAGTSASKGSTPTP